MSMNFRNELTGKQCNTLKDMFDVSASDKRTFLLNDTAFNSKSCGDLATLMNQVAELELNNIGDTKKLSDGSKYKLSENGWRKI
jgi:hypothetical protein